MSKFNKDGSYILTGSQDRTVNLWNPMRELLIKSYTAVHNYEVLDLAVYDDNSKFVSCGGDKQAFLQDVATGQVVKRFSGHQSRINCCAIGGESAILATGSYDCEVKIWDLKDRKSYLPIQRIKEFKDSVSEIQFDGEQMIVSSIDGNIRCFDLRKGQLTEDSVNMAITKFSFSTDKRLISLNCQDSQIRVVERGSGNLLATLSGNHKSEFYSTKSQFSWDDGLVITGSDDGMLGKGSISSFCSLLRPSQRQVREELQAPHQGH